MVTDLRYDYAAPAPTKWQLADARRLITSRVTDPTDRATILARLGYDEPTPAPRRAAPVKTQPSSPRPEAPCKYGHKDWAWRSRHTRVGGGGWRCMPCSRAYDKKRRTR